MFLITILDAVQNWLATLGFEGGVKDFINGIFDAFYGILGK
jgi:hypothetical protein